jgi:hypothetical protein
MEYPFVSFGYIQKIVFWWILKKEVVGQAGLEPATTPL